MWEATPRLRYRRSIGGKGCAEGQLLRPSGLALDAAHVYVADSGNHRVCKFTHGGSFVLAIGGYGAAAGQFMLPRGLALCGELLLVAEEGRGVEEGGARVQVLTRDGAPKGQLREAGFGGLLGICVDPEQRCALAAARLGLRLRPTPATPYRYVPSPPLIWIQLKPVPRVSPSPHPGAPSPSTASATSSSRVTVASARAAAPYPTPNQ